MRVNGEILIKPLISEKSTRLGEKLNKFTFVVSRDANKLEIKTAVESLYGVNVSDVRTAVIPGKAKTRQTKTGLARGQKQSFKKAMITLKEGEVIDFYSNI